MFLEQYPGCLQNRYPDALEYSTIDTLALLSEYKGTNWSLLRRSVLLRKPNQLQTGLVSLVLSLSDAIIDPYLESVT
jgi:hypothetical protein